MADTAPMLPQLQAMLDRAKTDAAKRESARIYQFPFWPEPDRGIPNEFSRSALFAAIQAKGRTYLDNQEIASQEGYTITYTGQRLDQTHLDVFEGLMHIARGIHEGNKIRFSAHSFLKLIGRDTGNAQHKWLLKTMNHLTATSVQIKRGTAKVFWGSLLPKGYGRPDSGDYEVEITRELIQLFDRGFTQVDWEQRRLLRRKPLAQWLQIYYSSHAKPYPVTIAFLHKKAGSSTKSLRKFKQLVKAALNELKIVGAIVEWTIDDTDKVHVVRVPTPSQQRYLARMG